MFEFITNLISSASYFGVFALMVLENVFPPIPSEMIMPMAGFVAARGEMNVYGVLVAGTVGSVVGALPWYYAGKLLGRDRLHRLASRHGRWMTVTAEDLDKAISTFARHGRKCIFFGRLVPAIRTLISVPAGIASMALLPFLAYSTAGSLIWTGLLTAGGYILNSNYDAVATMLDPVSKAVVALLVATYLYRFCTFRTARKI